MRRLLQGHVRRDAEFLVLVLMVKNWDDFCENCWVWTRGRVMNDGFGEDFLALMLLPNWLRVLKGFRFCFSSCWRSFPRSPVRI
jgi:hypothetical protein